MNLGPRKMQISSAAVPPIRIRPIQRSSDAIARRAAASTGSSTQAPPDPLQADPARALDEHRVAGAQQAAQQLAAPGASATLALARVARRASRPPAADRHEQLDARAPRVRADLAVERGASGPSSSMSPSTATRRAAPSRPDRRAPLASTSGWRCSSRRPARRRRPAPRARPRSAEKRTSSAPARRCSPSARAAAIAAQQVAQVVGLRERGRSSIRVAAPSSITTAPSRPRSAQSHVAARAEA